jgi:amylosucrase
MSYLDDPALAEDNRWMHRPHFDVDAVARRDDPTGVEGRVFAWIQRLARIRRDLPALHAAGESELLAVDDPHVLAWRRRHPRSGHFVGMVNFAEHPVSVDARAFDGLGELETVLSADGPLMLHDGRAHLPGLGFVWLAEA